MATADLAVLPARIDGRMPFGFLAYLGAGISLVFCYFNIFASLAAAYIAIDLIEINPHLQAVFMWVFCLVAVIGLAKDRNEHGNTLPLSLGVFGLLLVIGTLYSYYDGRILMTGYVVLLVAAFLNQNTMLRVLNGTVQSQASQLKEINNTLEERVRAQVGEIERLARLKRFLAPEVADLIMNEGRESLLDSHRRYIACLFCDIRDFTPLSESLEPEEVMDLLQSYHERVGGLVAAHGGTIGYRAGDGLMIFFNDPLPCDAPVLRATQLARSIEQTFAEIRKDWEKLGYRLDIGIGIAAGYATLGMIGTERRVDYTAIGNVVNVAARLCEMAGEGRILINQRAYLDVEDAVQVEALGALDLKGIGRQTEAYRLVAIG